jgi:F-type H+-transporting ATPase subunit gamma
LAAVGLIDLKRRIKSVVSTQKITKAMGLVATVKFKIARANLEKYKRYYEKFSKSVNKIISMPGMSDTPYSAENDSDRDMYIVITSDSGLCGSYNANVLNKVYSEIKESKDEVLLVTVGQKGKNFLEARGYKTTASFTDMNVNPAFKEASNIIKLGMEYFISGKVKNVYVVYTEFHSTAKQNVEIMRLLPLKKEIQADNDFVLYEPSYKSIYDNTIPKYLNASIYNTLVNSIASEFAIRMSSMDSATKNASEVLDKLKTMFNKARQANITREISEIVSGAEALKD